jgi:hypothetical protein
MSSDEMTVSRGTGSDRVENQKNALDQQAEELFARAATAPAERLAGPPRFWDVIAIGPYQVPDLQPSRVLEVGEQATIQTLVYLNPNVPNPAPGQNACDIITGFGGKIEISYVTARTDTMQPVPQLSATHCIETAHGQCWYSDYYTFTPRESACLYLTNICVRICNCNNRYVRQYSGFARWVANLDFDLIFGAPVWQFDHPIRYMVSDFNVGCACS